MPQMHYNLKHKAWVKECLKCDTVYIGHNDTDKAEKALSKYFAQDRATSDGFYARCRKCVSKVQRASRDGRVCDPEKLLSIQNNKCGICEKQITYERGNGAKVLAYIDHNHGTNEIRGVLCPRCNSLLAIVENFDWLRRALCYLAKYGQIYNG